MVQIVPRSYHNGRRLALITEGICPLVIKGVMLMEYLIIVYLIIIALTELISSIKK